MKTAAVVTGALAAAAVMVAAPTVTNASPPMVRNGVGPSSTASSHRDGTALATSTRYFITFDTGTSPCAFRKTAPLREEYAGLGVHFSGAAGATGGSVLNECGNFGVNARSGKEFLAFNAAGGSAAPERIRFDALQRSVRIFVAVGFGNPSTFTLRAYNGGNLVARTAMKVTSAGWIPLEVTAAQGISTVVLRSSFTTFLVDDLQYSSLS